MVEDPLQRVRLVRKHYRGARWDVEAAGVGQRSVVDLHRGGAEQTLVSRGTEQHPFLRGCGQQLEGESAQCRSQDSGSSDVGTDSTFQPTMDFKPSVSVLFGHYSLPRRRILIKPGRTKFEKTT